MTGTGHTDAVVEAVLSGMADDAVPADLARAAGLVRAAQAEASASETELPPWLFDTLANGIDDLPTTVAHRRAVRIGRRIAVVTTSLVMATTGMAAATGRLPDPAQAAIARAARHAGVDLPEPATIDRPRPTPTPTSTPTPLRSTSSPDRPSSSAATVDPPDGRTPAATAPAKRCAPPAVPKECAESRSTRPSPPPTTEGPRRDGDPPPAATRPTDPGPPSSNGPSSTRPTRHPPGSRGGKAPLAQR